MFHHLHFFIFNTLKEILSAAGYKIIFYPIGAVAPAPSPKKRFIYNKLVNSLFYIFGQQMNLCVMAENEK
jgi:hypothetical protein